MNPSLQAVTPSSSEAAASLSGSKSGSSGKLAIRVKVTRSKAWLEEYVKSNEPVKMFLAAVYNYHDSSGEFVAEAFHSLPSAKVRVANCPIDSQCGLTFYFVSLLE